MVCMTSPVARAAPVEVGTMLIAAARARRASLWGPSTRSSVARVGVHRGHEPLLDTEGLVEDLDHGYETVGGARPVGDHLVNVRSNVVSLTPITKVASAPFDGADTIATRAPVRDERRLGHGN